MSSWAPTSTPPDAMQSEGEELAERTPTASLEIYSAPSFMGMGSEELKALAEFEEDETIGMMMASL